MRLSPKRIVVLVALAVLGTYAALALRPRPLAVETARALRGPLRVTVDEEGETRIHDRYVVGAPVAGRLARIALHAGDAVARGDVVARLDALPLDSRARRQAEARVAGAQAERRAAEAVVLRRRTDLEQARRTLHRLERLAAEQVVATEVVEAARTAAAAAASDLEGALQQSRAAEFEVTNARAALLDSDAADGGSVPVLAPVGGRVLRVCEECEKVVAAGTPLLEVGDPADLEVVVDVLSSDAMAIRPGAPMLLEIDSEAGVRWRARVRSIEPAGFTKVSPLGVEEQRVNVIGELLDPPGALGDRFRVDARIVLWEGADVLKVPAGALFRERAAWAVFVVVDGRARRRPVRLGHRNPDEAEILGGLAAGEIVVVHPSDALADGVRVAPG